MGPKIDSLGDKLLMLTRSLPRRQDIEQDMKIAALLFLCTLAIAAGAPQHASRADIHGLGCSQLVFCFINPCMIQTCPTGTTCTSCNCVAKCVETKTTTGFS